jgi:hypothetical protein
VHRSSSHGYAKRCSSLLDHVTALHDKPMLDIVIQAQSEGRWISEFDIYLAFVWRAFQAREFPYIHAREKTRCGLRDAYTPKQDTDIIFMAYGDHYAGHDLCSGSTNNCTSTVAFCERLPHGSCRLTTTTLLFAVVPCSSPPEKHRYSEYQRQNSKK